MIWFMLVTGVRNSEVRFVSRTSINLENRMVLIIHKQKNDARSTSITTALSEELKRYINHPNYIAWEEKGNDKLFFQKDKPLTYKALRVILNNLCMEANLSRTVTPHDLRRTAGYLMQSVGMNMVEIQRQLGHQIMSTTLPYIPPLNDLSKILI